MQLGKSNISRFPASSPTLMECSAASRIERARFDGRGRVQTAYVTRLWASALRLLNSSERPTAATASSAVLFTFCFFCKR